MFHKPSGTPVEAWKCKVGDVWRHPSNIRKHHGGHVGVPSIGAYVSKIIKIKIKMIKSQQ